MGQAKKFWMEQIENEAYEKKCEWIQSQMDDPDADEDTEGWHELSDEYDEFHSDEYHSGFYGYDDYEVEGKSRADIFRESISAIRELSKVKVSSACNRNKMVMLYGHIVSTLEGYLSATFIDYALRSDKFLRLLIESDPEFSKRKFTLKEIFIKKDNLKNDIKIYLRDLIFHDVAKVKPMYKSVLEIDFGDIAWLVQAVMIRHHCVHRAGYDKDGNEVDIPEEMLNTFIDQCVNLVAEIEVGLGKLSIPEN